MKRHKIKYFGTTSGPTHYNLTNIYGGEDSDFDEDCIIFKTNFYTNSLSYQLTLTPTTITKSPATLPQKYKPFNIFRKHISKKEFNFTAVRKKYHAYYLHKTFEYTYNKYWVETMYDIFLENLTRLSLRKLSYFYKNLKMQKLRRSNIYKWFVYL